MTLSSRLNKLEKLADCTYKLGLSARDIELLRWYLPSLLLKRDYRYLWKRINMQMMQKIVKRMSGWRVIAETQKNWQGIGNIYNLLTRLNKHKKQ